MKVSRSEWQQRMRNLIERRKTPSQAPAAAYSKVGDYAAHLSKIKVGKTVLDVGCGSMAAANHLPKGTTYHGIDAFPVNDSVTRMEIEECSFPDAWFDTVICFATLDGVHDLKRAIDQMKRVCSGNVYFLTGIGIEPDRFHTFKITEELLVDLMSPFGVGYVEFVTEKVMLIEFLK